ncbi:AAA family ATPase [Streptomyces sp. NPDC001601]|uniref:AAA family ATPase n=1 Tax=Streptomyces sp. NPDC001601 TaxID=3364592 RepID=UPI0036C0F226
MDPRNGGDSAALDGSMPTPYGTASTPSDGTHTFIRSIGERSKDNLLPGIDVKAGDAEGNGRGFAFIAPTVKLSKTTGELKPYRWVMPLDMAALREVEDDDSGEELAALIRKSRESKTHPASDSEPVDHTGPIPGGGRHAALVSYAGRLRHRNLTYQEAEGLFRLRWQDCEQPPKADAPYSWEEAQKTLRDVFGRYASGERYADGTGGEQSDSDASVTLRRLKLTRASTIKPKPVIWAWEPNPGEGRIPAGALTLAAGREGTGKTLQAIWLVARITTGALPGSFHGRPRDVFYAAVEDSWERTIVPRLIAAGADLDRVFRVDVENVLSGDEMSLSLPTDVDLIEQEIKARDVAALVIDPLMSTLNGGNTDAHRNQDVRRALEPLVRMAERTKAMTYGIAHFNKGGSTDAAQLISGSGAFKDLARAVLVFAKNKETGEQVMSQAKNSLGRLDLPHIGYVIEGVDVKTDEGPAHVGLLQFTGPVDQGVEEILSMSSDPEEAGERAEAAAWLLGYLTDQGGEAARTDVMKAGKAQGFSEATIKRAKNKAKVTTTPRDGFGGGTAWRHPDNGQSAHSQLSGLTSQSAETTEPTVGSVSRLEEPQSQNVTANQAQEMGPCTQCKTPTRRYGAGAHPLCENCRDAAEENQS